MYRAVVYTKKWDDTFLSNLSDILDSEINDTNEVYRNESIDANDRENEPKIQNNILKDKYLSDIHASLESSERIKYLLEQKTPLRVLHRRPNMVRNRSVELVRVRKMLDTYEFIIRAEAGTYIKEFINGDFGRTNISITALNKCYCDCIELDVIKIEE